MAISIRLVGEEAILIGWVSGAWGEVEDKVFFGFFLLIFFFIFCNMKLTK